MLRTRRALVGFVIGWLVCQAATLAIVPAALARMTDDSLAGCTCPAGVDAACPMHHPSEAGSKPCAMRSATTGPTALVQSLFGVAGFVPAPAAAAVAPPAERTTGTPAVLAPRRPWTPDPPPPRA